MKPETTETSPPSAWVAAMVALQNLQTSWCWAVPSSSKVRNLSWSCSQIGMSSEQPQPFFIEQLLRWKSYSAKVDKSAQNLGADPVLHDKMPEIVWSFTDQSISFFSSKYLRRLKIINVLQKIKIVNGKQVEAELCQAQLMNMLKLVSSLFCLWLKDIFRTLLNNLKKIRLEISETLPKL